MDSNDRPSHAQITLFLQHLVTLTRSEEQVEDIESTASVSSSSPELLEQRGIALSSLSPARTTIGLGGKTLVELQRSSAWHVDPTFPPNQFRNGDAVLLIDQAAAGGKKGKAVELKTKPIQGLVWKVLETKLVIAVGKGGPSNDEEGSDEVELPQVIRLLKISNPATYTRQISTLRTLLRSFLPQPPPSSPPSTYIPPPLSPLVSVLLGLSSPSPPLDIPPLTFYNPHLNPSQRTAVVRALSSPEVSLIWGPPGTGKTQTLVEIIRHSVAAGQRVLVCGGSNLSVDNLLLRLTASSILPSIPVTRLGHPARVMSALHVHTLDSQSSRTDASGLLAGITGDIEALQEKLGGGDKKGKGRLRGKDRAEGYREMRELRNEYRRREGGVVGEVLGAKQVILATTHGAGSYMLSPAAFPHQFDTLIIDEASQTVEPSSWIPILRLLPATGRLILAGDHRQLGPVVRSEKEKENVKSQSSSSKSKIKDKVSDKKVEPAAESTTTVDVDASATISATLATTTLETSILAVDDAAVTPPPAPEPLPDPHPRLPLTSLSRTLFSRLLALHGDDIRTLLNTQYRFNSKIMDYPNHALYEGKLVAAEGNRGRRLEDLELEGGSKVEGEWEEVVFIDTQDMAMYERGSGETDSKSNENEATLVVNYLDELLAANVPPSEIAIISPYNAQVSLLASLLQKDHPEIEIGSIDGFQGREKEVVIISLVRSNPEASVGFLATVERLNVAMTRARSHLVIIGDSQTVSKGGKYLKGWMDWLEENADVRFASAMS